MEDQDEQPSKGLFLGPSWGVLNRTSPWESSGGLSSGAESSSGGPLRVGMNRNGSPESPAGPSSGVGFSSCDFWLNMPGGA